MRISSLLGMIREPRKIKEAIRRRLPFRTTPIRVGFNTPNTYTSYVPDRFCWNYTKYLQMGNGSFELNMKKFMEANDNNVGDLSRYYFITLVCDQISKENVLGDFAELGVYKGNTAFTIVETARRLGRTTYLFDTFEGFSTSDLTGVDRGRAVEFDDTSLDSVRSFIGNGNTRYVRGHFPESTNGLPHDLRFALVHIDCDLYAPFSSALSYFYARMMPSG
jgi:Macrocin-O-methyltransferase (TylF)